MASVCHGGFGPASTRGCRASELRIRSEQPFDMTTPQRIAVIGSGISGLGAAWALSQRHHVTLIEGAERLGGHARTIDVSMDDRPVPVDTGFIVYNERNYPNLSTLLSTIGVATEPTDMSFSVRSGSYEFGAAASALATRPTMLMSRRTRAILRGILRFRSDVAHRSSIARSTTLADHLRDGAYPEPFIEDYLLPLAAAVWSGTGSDAASMPVGTFLDFLGNHGLFEVPRPRWRTVSGGSREYVDRLAKEIPRIWTGAPVRSVTRTEEGVVVTTTEGHEVFDHVVLATHAPQSIALLAGDLREDEAEILGSFGYASNRAVVHRDTSVMPSRRALWSAWNASRTRVSSTDPVSVTYWMNRLQNLDDRYPVFVTLNPGRPLRGVIDTVVFQHPQFDTATERAQRRLHEIQGRGGVWHCGAWTGYGFHEDGLQSGLTVAAALGSPAPWDDSVTPVSPASVHTAPTRYRTR